mgnify:CR=1 FL=1
MRRLLLCSTFLLFAACPVLPASSKPYQGKTLVVVTCHADDFSIFAGGSIATLIAQGYRAYLVRVTDDEKDGLIDPPHVAAINDRQVRDVAKTIGIQAIYSLNFKNDELQRVPETLIRDRILYFIRKLHADTIFTFDPYARYGEENPDHLVTARAAEDAARHAWNPQYCPLQLRHGLHTQLVLDGYYWARGPIEVNKVFDTARTENIKIAALNQQLNMLRAPGQVEEVRKADQAIGAIYGYRTAEICHHIWYLAPTAGNHPSADAVMHPPLNKGRPGATR